MGKLTIITSLLLLTFFHANAQTEANDSETTTQTVSSSEGQIDDAGTSESTSGEDEYVYSKFGYGITLGGTASTFDLYSGTRYGLTLGAYGTYSIFDKLNVRAEVLYFQNGGNKPDVTRTFESSSGQFTQRVHDRSVRLQNILVPVMLTYELPVGNLAPYVGAGGTYQFNFAAHELAKRTYAVDGGTSTSPTQSQNVYDEYQRSTFGLIFSLGVKIPEVINDYSLRIEGRYNLGMQDINASVLNVEAQAGKELRSNSFMLTISLGY
ncbi:outer membrane beta-barrel protein [Flammeovirga aprica]|uniref:PorT family protein n=1 Tax=Flammeovirga aprica JL-4 TaxID=694437 RepID=A0A7X9RVG1_9BACT|nr:outer membrane beta-barrel protein [Flammeovirga aprica]NME69428.1 PorT family protein [Flammeovirga aprica JL-4]